MVEGQKEAGCQMKGQKLGGLKRGSIGVDFRRLGKT
jgi:hypothetical protein